MNILHLKEANSQVQNHRNHKIERVNVIFIYNIRWKRQLRIKDFFYNVFSKKFQQINFVNGGKSKCNVLIFFFIQRIKKKIWLKCCGKQKKIFSLYVCICLVFASFHSIIKLCLIIHKYLTRLKYSSIKLKLN